MPVVVHCPGCRAPLSVPESAEPQVAECPACHRPFTVSVPPAADAGTPEPAPGSDRRPRPVRPIVVGVVVSVALLAVGVVVLLRGDHTAGDAPSDAERDRDYHEILDLSYDIQAVRAGSGFWLGEYRQWAGLDDTLADRPAGNEVFTAYDALLRRLEAERLQKREAFVATHGFDPKDWKAHFARRYPEHDVIFDQIEAVVTRRCRVQAVQSSAHLLARREAMDPAAFDDYRAEYLRGLAPALIRDVRDEVRRLDSVASLREKVRGR